MRNKFFDVLLTRAREDKDVMVLMSDTGATVLQQWRKELPDQCINVGISEQNMIGLAAGLAMEGKKVYCYGIIPFMTSRCHDQVRVDICCQNLPVTIVGVGTGYDYNTLGPTHHGVEDIAIMRALPGLRIYSPSDEMVTEAIANTTYLRPSPTYVRLAREGLPNFYTDEQVVKRTRLAVSTHYPQTPYRNATIVSTGRISYDMYHLATDLVNKDGINACLIDVHRIKPLHPLTVCHPLIVVEEHSKIGGLGDAVRAQGHRVDLHLACPDEPVRIYGSREHLLKSVGLDRDTIKKKIISLLT